MEQLVRLFWGTNSITTETPPKKFLEAQFSIFLGGNIYYTLNTGGYKMFFYCRIMILYLDRILREEERWLG